jgi:hypothetical protein
MTGSVIGGQAEGAIEHWYRRLLACYPADYRRMYGEEMIGVLLASTPSGKARPGIGDAADLVTGGIRARLRHIRTLDGDARAGWRDAMAAFGVVAPILMTFYLAYQFSVISKLDRLRRLAGIPRPFASQSATGQTAILLMAGATITTIAALAICPVLLRQRHRLAVALITIVPVALGLVATIYVNVTGAPVSDAPLAFTLVFLMELIAVIISPGPGRGWQVLGARSLVIAAVLAALAAACEWLLQSGALSSLSIARTPIELAIVAVGIALILIFGSALHKRLLALLAIPGYPLLVYVQLYSVLLAPRNTVPVVELLYLPTLAIALLVGLAAWQSGRRATPPAAA